MVVKIYFVAYFSGAFLILNIVYDNKLLVENPRNKSTSSLYCYRKSHCMNYGSAQICVSRQPNFVPNLYRT